LPPSWQLRNRVDPTPGHHIAEATTPPRGATPRRQQPDEFHIASFLSARKSNGRFLIHFFGSREHEIRNNLIDCEIF
jgi:hypothetical protein